MSNQPSEGDFYVGLVIGFIFGIVISSITAWSMGTFHQHWNAIQHHAAYYTVDEYGNTRFHWNDEKPKEEK